MTSRPCASSPPSTVKTVLHQQPLPLQTRRTAYRFRRSTNTDTPLPDRRARRRESSRRRRRSTTPCRIHLPARSPWRLLDASGDKLVAQICQHRFALRHARPQLARAADPALLAARCPQALPGGARRAPLGLGPPLHHPHRDQLRVPNLRRPPRHAAHPAGARSRFPAPTRFASPRTARSGLTRAPLNSHGKMDPRVQATHRRSCKVSLRTSKAN